MGKPIDFCGQKIGYLTVVARDLTKRNHKYGRFWICECECGNAVSISSTILKHRRIPPSCGCKKPVNHWSHRHGKRYHSLYSVYVNMIFSAERQYGLHSEKFICERWKASNPDGINNFISDVPEKPAENYAFVRIDQEMPWSPENYIWKPWKASPRYRTSNKIKNMDEARLIRQLARNGESVEILAARFGCGKMCVRNIINEISWKEGIE